MLPKPDVGQLVRLEAYDGRLIVKRVSDDGGNMYGPPSDCKLNLC